MAPFIKTLYNIWPIFRVIINRKCIIIKEVSLSRMNSLILVHFYFNKTRRQGVLVANDLNKLLSFLRCFVQKTIRYCRISSQIVVCEVIPILGSLR